MPEPEPPPRPAPHPESRAERDEPRRREPTRAARTVAVGCGAPFARPTRAQVVVAVLLALVGFAGVTQVRTNQVDDTYAGLRQQDLIDILNGLADTTQRAQAEIQRLEETRDDLQSDTSARQAALEQARQQAAGAQHPGRHRPGPRPGRDASPSRRWTGRSRSVRSSTWSRRCAPRAPRRCRSTTRSGWSRRPSFEDGTGGLLVDGRLLEAPFAVDVIGNPDALVDGAAVPGRARRTSSRRTTAPSSPSRRSSRSDIETVRDPAEADFAEAQQ